jgi:branched-subunit amino acid transport protein
VEAKAMSIGDPHIVLLLGLFGTFLLRFVGVVGAGRLEQDTPLFRWIGCVAFAIAAGLMAKIIFLPSGVLAESALATRLIGVGVGLLVFFAFNRRLLWSLVAGLFAFVLTGFVFDG